MAYRLMVECGICGRVTITGHCRMHGGNGPAYTLRVYTHRRAFGGVK